ncbi:MAG: hypothetical protein ABIJ59_02615 [Pseudomonadota bacterium]
MLSEFYQIVEVFEASLKKCGKSLAEWPDVDHIQRQRLNDLGLDMIGFGESFIRKHIHATMWLIDDAYEVNKNHIQFDISHEDYMKYLQGDRDFDKCTIQKIEEYIQKSQKSVQQMVNRTKSKAYTRSQESTNELKAVYKAYFFFIRAFHDACYGILLNLNGQQAGAYSSMNKCLKKQPKPMYNQVASIDNYIDWFKDFKNKRDSIKKGVSFSLCGPQWDVGVGFTKVTRAGGVTVNVDPQAKDKFRLKNLIIAFSYSTKLLDVIIRHIPESTSSLYNT